MGQLEWRDEQDGRGYQALSTNNTHTIVYIYIHMCIYIYICVYIYELCIYIYIYIHTLIINCRTQINVVNIG